MFVLDLILAAFDYTLGRLFNSSLRKAGSRTRQTGDKAEAFALAMLQRDGFSLLEQSLADFRGELDLVGRQRGFDGIVVVEVRSRSEGGMIDPRATVRGTKQRQVTLAAKRLLKRRGLLGQPVRFDIVGVWLNAHGEPVRAEHFVNAFGFKKPKRR